MSWLTKLRKKGIIKPIKPGGRWLYSKEQVRQIAALIAAARKCEECGNPRPLGSVRFCRECNRYRKKHWYESFSLGEKAEHIKRCLAWRKANPERWKGIQYRVQRKYRAKQGREAVIAEGALLRVMRPGINDNAELFSPAGFVMSKTPFSF